MELDMRQDEILKPIIYRNVSIHKNQICIFYIIGEKNKMRGRMRGLFFMSVFFRGVVQRFRSVKDLINTLILH